MNLPLCRKENRKNEPKTAQSGGFLCKMTKKSQKIRHFDRAPTFVSAGISAFWHFSTKNEAKFVQNYLLTNSRNYGILLIESEGTTMIGIKRTEYTVLNDEQGQTFKKKFIKEHDVVSVEENEKLIIITTGETFELNDFLWV